MGKRIAGSEKPMTGLGAFGSWSGVASTGGCFLLLVCNDGGFVDWSKLTSLALGFQVSETVFSGRLPILMHG
jgi:hypothetical protein